MSIEQDIDYGDRYRAWHEARTKGTTKSTFHEWTEDGKRDRRLLAKSTGWGTGLNTRKVVMGLNTESMVNITAESGIIPIVMGTPGIQPPPVLKGNGTEALPPTPQPSQLGRVDEDLSLLASPDLSPRLLDNSTLSDKDFIETNYDATSSEEKVPSLPQSEGSNGEAGLSPQERTTARATTETPEETMTPPSTEEATPVDVEVNRRTADRDTPPKVNLLQEALIPTVNLDANATQPGG